MSNQKVVEVIYGKLNKYEIVRSESLLFSPTFSILRDGRYFKGSYDSFAAAVEAAKRAG